MLKVGGLLTQLSHAVWLWGIVRKKTSVISVSNKSALSLHDLIAQQQCFGTDAGCLPGSCPCSYSQQTPNPPNVLDSCLRWLLGDFCRGLSPWIRLGSPNERGLHQGHGPCFLRTAAGRPGLHWSLRRATRGRASGLWQQEGSRHGVGWRGVWKTSCL